MSTLIAPWLANSHWPTVPIRYVARLGTGHTPSRQQPEYWENCSVPWVTLADVWQLRSGAVDVIRETKEKISPLGIANSSAVKHPAGTVILSRTASVGFSAILGMDAATSQDFATWTCGSQLNRRYLLHALRAMAPDLRRVAAGSTHKTIYMPDIEQLRIPLPPLDEQRRIADFLDKELASLRHLIDVEVITLKKLRERDLAYIDWTVSKLASMHGVTSLRKFMLRAEQGDSPQCDNIEATPDEWGVVKVSAVKDGKFQNFENKRLPTDMTPNRKYEIRDGDVLITRANTPTLVGAVAVAKKPREKLLLCDKIFRVTLSSGLDSDFLTNVARGSIIRGLCTATAHGTSQSMTNLKLGDIKSWPLPAAPIADQRTAAESMSAHSSHISRLTMAINRQLELLAERRQALITAAITGQLT